MECWSDEQGARGKGAPPHLLRRSAERVDWALHWDWAHVVFIWKQTSCSAGFYFCSTSWNGNQVMGLTIFISRVGTACIATIASRQYRARWMWLWLVFRSLFFSTETRVATYHPWSDSSPIPWHKEIKNGEKTRSRKAFQVLQEMHTQRLA